MIVAYTPDLMDRSRITSAVGAGAVRFVATADALVGLADADVVVVDLGRRGALDALAAIVASGVRVVAFGSHVDHALLDAARAAGVDEVLPRSRFFATAAELLRA